MSPPQLTRDTPVFDVFHPIAIAVLEFWREETNVVIHYIIKRRLTNVFHVHKPLERQAWLDYHICALRESNFIDVNFSLHKITSSLKVFNDFRSYFKTIHANIQLTSFADCTIRIHHIDHFKLVFFTKHKVIHIMSRSYF